MSELPALQKAFTEYLRNPDNRPIPAGLDKRRMEVYAGLVFNNVSSLLSDFFPVIKSILSKDQWRSMVRNFFISHQSQTPYFMALAGEFVEYLAHSQLIGDLPDFLIELAHYEWMELALYTLDEELPEHPLPNEGLDELPLCLSPLAQPLAYAYPVHRISPECRPDAPGKEPTHLLLARDAGESVKFYELQPLAFRLLYDLRQDPGLTARQWLGSIAARARPENRAQFIENGIDLLQSFNERRLLRIHNHDRIAE